MLIIRLQRTGRRNTPAYRIVLADKRRAVKGNFQEVLGHYLPAREPVVLEINEARILEWVKKGAQVTDTVARLLTKNGVKGLESFVTRYVHRKKKGEEEAPPAPAAAPAAEKAPEPAAAPAEEEKAEPAPAAEPEKKPEEAPAPAAEEKKAEPTPAEAPAEGGDSAAQAA